MILARIRGQTSTTTMAAIMVIQRPRDLRKLMVCISGFSMCAAYMSPSLVNVHPGGFPVFPGIPRVSPFAVGWSHMKKTRKKKTDGVNDEFSALKRGRLKVALAGALLLILHPSFPTLFPELPNGRKG